MKVISLFDGMACGLQALKNLGVPVSEYHACEIDKYAIQIAKKNHPEIIHHGSVTEFRGFNCDILIGGSPCQGFSFAGKQLNFEDPRSKLFFEFVRILKESDPKYFLLENVNMKKQYQEVISNLLGVEPIMINSSLLSAQNRVRLYWTNIGNINQPQDKGILLKDILENGIVDRDKSYCIDANYFKGGNPDQYFTKCRRQLVFNEDWICGRVVGRKIDPKTGKRDDYNPDLKIQQRFESRLDYKTVTLTTVQKDNILFNGNIYRKLTPIECERLQTLPDNYTKGVSDSQRYKMLGNGWTVSVIEHILKEVI